MAQGSLHVIETHGMGPQFAFASGHDTAVCLSPGGRPGGSKAFAILHAHFPAKLLNFNQKFACFLHNRCFFRCLRFIAVMLPRGVFFAQAIGLTKFFPLWMRMDERIQFSFKCSFSCPVLLPCTCFEHGEQQCECSQFRTQLVLITFQHLGSPGPSGC